MKIEPAMDLQELAERMGSEATIAEAAAMRDQLLSFGYRGQDTRDLSDADWNDAILESRQQ